MKNDEHAVGARTRFLVRAVQKPVSGKWSLTTEVGDGISIVAQSREDVEEVARKLVEGMYGASGEEYDVVVSFEDAVTNGASDAEVFHGLVEGSEKVNGVIIVGSGPAACTAAIYTSRAGIDTVAFASSDAAGGELMNTTEVENFPGFPEGVTGPVLMEKMLEQAGKFGAVIRFEDVSEIDLATKTVKAGGGSSEDKVYQADAIILATGSAYRKLGVPGEEELTGNGVSWCATCDAMFFRGLDVVVVGGGDSAMEEAMQLAEHANRVRIIHRSDQYKASEIMYNRALANPKIEFVEFAEVSEIIGADGFVTGVEVKNTLDGSISRFDTDGVFIAIGSDPRTHLFKDQLQLNSDTTVKLKNFSETSVTGVFAAGDLADNRYRQAVTAAGSGAAAALDAEKYLRSLGDAKLLDR